MSDSAIEAKVKEIIIEQLDANAEDIRPEASFIDDLQADSLAVVELVLALEENFDIKIPDDEVDQIRTVGDAIKYISDRSRG